MNQLLIFIGKFLSIVSKNLNLGNGSTWPGHIALNVNENFISDILKKSKTKIIVVTGTNGKTTTSKILETILRENDKSVFLNSSGANLLNGVASSIISNSNFSGKTNKDFAIFEIDENNLSLFIKTIKPDCLIALNLFRDQLDRYGEVDSIAKKWQEAYRDLDGTTFILNADDPQIAFLGKGIKSNVHYFGLDAKGEKKHQHASDSILCPNCGNKLYFKTYYFSHLGDYRCTNCEFKKPQTEISKAPYYPLFGDYANYDTLAAVLTSKKLGIQDNGIEKGLKAFKPAFGRQEELTIGESKVKIFLSKNPTSLNESLRTIKSLKKGPILLVLNDRIPDGLDVSWIWDVDFEDLIDRKNKIISSGDRVYDLSIRLKYAGFNLKESEVFENLEEAVKNILQTESEFIYIVPTYSAMLDVRKVLTGRKIL
jgi:UDP-N-acetylmuramyl tripeptide synthase